MRKAFVLGLAAMMVLWMPAGSTAAGTTTGIISGTAQDLSGGRLANVSVRVRNAKLGRVILETQTGTAGQFLVPGMPPDIYIVEALDSSGQVIGVSPTVSTVAGEPRRTSARPAGR